MKGDGRKGGVVVLEKKAGGWHPVIRRTGHPHPGGGIWGLKEIREIEKNSREFILCKHSLSVATFIGFLCPNGEKRTFRGRTSKKI